MLLRTPHLELRVLQGNEEVSLYYGQLPLGCELCRKGGKLVVFITGQCSDGCYYCPVSEERFGKEKGFANELEVNDMEDYVGEAYRMNALGAGITGGDPLLALDKTVGVIRRLKDEFGKEFHIHLYTSGRYATYDALMELRFSGLDEIRFHPTKPEFLNGVRRAIEVGLEVGLEIPAVPGSEEEIVKLAKWAEDVGVKFININELELNERNSGPLNSKGFTVSHGLAGVRGSFDTASKVLRELANSRITAHYCSSVYKDIVETRTRFLRTARKSRKPYEEISGEGLVVRAFVKTSGNQWLEELGEKAEDGYFISPNEVEGVIRSLQGDAEVWIFEEMPDARRLRVSERMIFKK